MNDNSEHVVWLTITSLFALIYTKVNAPHYWNAEYDDKENRLCLAW